MRQHRRQANEAGFAIYTGRLHNRDLLLSKGLADDIEPTGERRISECLVPPRGNGDRIVATRDFSGLMSSDWALASALAIAPIESLERCTVGRSVAQFEANGP